MKPNMGITISDQNYPDLNSVPPPFNLIVVDAYIRHWHKKAVIAPDRVSRAMADGHISALQMIRIAHGLPMLTVEVKEEAA
jgi:hypothetical protein